MDAKLKKIGRGLKSLGHFFAALSRTKKQSASPDPRKAAARRMRESMHASRAGSTANVSAAEGLYAKELAKGYKQPK